MKILEKRPLALILCIMLGGFSFFADFTWQIKLSISLVALLAIGIIYLFEDLKRSRNVLVIISLVAFSISLLLSILWSFAFYPTKYYESEVNIEGKIYSIDDSKSSVSVMVCKTEKINGRRDNHTLILYVDKEMARDIERYDIVSFKAEISELSSSDDGFDGRSYYVSRGYSALCDNVTDLTFFGNEKNLADSLFSSFRLKLSNRLKKLTDFETGAFLSALIVGERGDLSGNTKLNFSRLGISHILALSGMHLAILSLALNFLLIRLGVKKKLRVSILVFLVLFYMGITGFSASVVRSGIMLIISGVLYLLAKKSDAITSLAIAVSAIVVIEPTAVYDVSLWLSAFATLGVVVFSEIAEKSDDTDAKWKKIWIFFKNAALVSVFAFCATFAFIAPRFDSFSVISVFTTILFSFVIQLFIYAGILLIIFGSIIPFGRIVVFFSNLILGFAEIISSSKLVCVSMSFVAVKVMIVLLSVFFFAFLVLDIKNKRKGVAITVIMLVSVFLTAEIYTVAVRYDDDVVYSPSASGDSMLLKSGGDTTLIYSGKAFASDGWDVLDYMTFEGLTYVDNFVLASYSYNTKDFLNTVIDGIKVERIMLPSPSTDDEIAQAEIISDLLSGYGTRLEFYELLSYIDFGEYRYRLFEKVDYTYGEYPSNVYEVVVGNERYTYLSTCKYEDLSSSSRALIYNSENLIIGSIGNSKYYIFDMRLPDSDKIMYFDEGRLTDDASEFYRQKGALVRCIKTPISLTK